MATETKPSLIAVPRLRIYGAGDLNRLRQFEYEGQIGREIVDFGQAYKDLQGTIALRDQATLFQAYILSESGQLDLPGDIRGVLHYLFKETGRGNVTNDACDYDRGDKGMKRVHDTDRHVLWKVAPERFEETSEGWKAIGGEEYAILVPQTGWVKCTNDGLYRPDTGTPFETGSEDEAIQSMIDHGIPSDLAREIRSYFWRGEEGQGVSAVDRYSSDRDGPFDVGAGRHPGNRLPDVGRFPSSRSASGASHADRSQISTVADELEVLASRLRDAAKE